MKETVYFVTGNKDKLKEAQTILVEFNVEQIELDLPELQGDPEKVAEEKAKMAYEKVKKPVFVDDTGLAFNALGGMPGIYIRYFIDNAGPEATSKMLDGFDDKSAYAFTSIGYCDGKQTKVFLGKCEGEITMPMSEGHGFAHGWDTIFKPNGYDKTFGCITLEEKNKISQRKRALDMLHKFLTN